MKRIIDANLNRATEALRVLEEIARFYLDDKNLCEQLKNIRHDICKESDTEYEELLKSRNTLDDVGVDVENKTERLGIESIFKANIKRLQQALRVLAEYSEKNDVYEKARYDSYTLEKDIWEKLEMNLNAYRLKDKKLYLVTNSDQFESEDAFLNAVASSLKGGVDIVQLREKNSSAKRIIELGKKIRNLCSMYDALFIVNDRIDIAKIVEADGVHLGQDDADIESAREILGKDTIVGISTHEPAQALKAVADGADYIGVGPVYTTPTKPGRPSVGLEYVKWVSENVDIPFFAIGGICKENCKEVIDAGSTRLAVVRAIINSDSPDSSARDFKNNLKDSPCGQYTCP